MTHTRLLEYENIIRTKMGAAFGGERVVFRGQDLHHELCDMEWMEFYLYGITGKRFSKPVVELLNFMWACTSYPDPRIWNNRIVSLAASSRATAPQALSAGLISSEASLFGYRVGAQAMTFLQRLGKAVQEGQKMEEFVERELEVNRVIPGFGRPMANGDERVPHIIGKIESLRLNEGLHYELCLEVIEFVEGKWGRKVNMAAFLGAKLADFGFTPVQYELYLFTAFTAGMGMGYMEELDKPEGTFLPFRCSSLVNIGNNIEKKWISSDE